LLRTTVAWILPGEAKNEAALRHLAARALRDFHGLAEEVDRSLQFAGTLSGFAVEFARLAQLAAPMPPTGNPPEPGPQTIPDTPESRLKLADTLEQGRLPSGKGPLVVVNRDLDPERVSSVWRVASALVPSQQAKTIKQWIRKWRLWLGGTATCLVFLLLWQGCGPQPKHGSENSANKDKEPTKGTEHHKTQP